MRSMDPDGSGQAGVPIANPHCARVGRVRWRSVTKVAFGDGYTEALTGGEMGLGADGVFDPCGVARVWV